LKKALALLIAVLLTAAHAEARETARKRIAEISRGYAPAAPGALERARAALLAVAPETWLEDLPVGPLRDALAAGLERGDVVTMFARAGRDPRRGAERIRDLAAAIAVRADATEILFAAGAVEPLAGQDPELLAAIAAADVIEGRTRLAIHLLSDPRTVLHAAGLFLEMNRPEGLRLVADVTIGDPPVPAEARARLGLFEPDLGNNHLPRELGPDRIAGLGAIARTDPDPALRLLAARLLAYSLDGEAYAAAVSTYRDARGADVEPDEWEILGKQFFTSASDASVPLEARQALLRGHLYRGGLFASADPRASEAAATAIRRMVAEDDDPRFRGMLLRFLDEWSYLFVDDSGLRPRPVPSFLALLSDLERAGDALARALVPAIRERSSRRPRPRGEWGEHRPAQEVASPVHSLVPGKGRVPADPTALVRSWIETDPMHLLDPEVRRMLDQLGTGERRRLLEAYPPGAIRGLLAAPPTRFARIRKRPRGDDLTGAANRQRLLEMLVDAPAHAPLLLEIEGLPSWSPLNRFAAGRVLQGAAARDRVLTLLEDPFLAAGFLCQSLLRPRDEDLARAARAISGKSVRPQVLLRMAEWMVEEMPEVLGPRDDEEWPEGPAPLPAELRGPLAMVLAEGSDPAAAWLAARVLALSGTVEDLRVLLRHGGDLAVGSRRGWHPLCDLAYHVDSREDLEAILEGLGRAELAPRARRDLFVHLLDFRFPPAIRRELVDRLTTWIRDDLPGLDGDLPEQLLVALATWSGEDWREEARRIYLEVVPSLPEGPRLRLRWRSLSWE
jgi:hypothetical protein